jgi:hypothetical protein
MTMAESTCLFFVVVGGLSAAASIVVLVAALAIIRREANLTVTLNLPDGRIVTLDKNMSAERLAQELNGISDNVKTALLLMLLQPRRSNLIIDSHRH